MNMELLKSNNKFHFYNFAIINQTKKDVKFLFAKISKNMDMDIRLLTYKVKLPITGVKEESMTNLLRKDVILILKDWNEPLSLQKANYSKLRHSCNFSQFIEDWFYLCIEFETWIPMGLCKISVFAHAKKMSLNIWQFCSTAFLRVSQKFSELFSRSNTWLFRKKNALASQETMN